MKVVLVNPPPRERVESHDAPDHPHLGLAYLAAYLREHEISCHVIDAKFEMIGMEEVAKRLTQLGPNLVGVTAMTHEVAQAARVASLAQAILAENKVWTVLGGAHATALPEESLIQFPELDVVVAGEGELTLLDLTQVLAQGKELSGISGIAYRIPGGGVGRNRARQAITNLDALPLPAWDLFPKSRVYTLITARGCPFGCNFCMRVSGRIVRKRSPESIVREFERDVEEFGATTIRIEDESFAVDRKQANELLDLLMRNGIHKRVDWKTQTRVDLVDLEFLRKLKAAGCTYVGFGIESGNEEILRRSGKGITLAEAERAISWAKRAGLATGSYFIIGHPFETRQTAWDTINFAAKLNTSTVAFGIMVPYPGTGIYEMARRGEGGYKIISSDWSDFNKITGNSVELETLRRDELERLELLAYFNFYIRNWRFFDFLSLLWRERKVVFKILTKLSTKGRRKLAA